MPLVRKYSIHVLLILSIFFIGFFLRFYNIAHLPGGLYPDETAIGYNAYSILKTGRDEYGKQFPLYFRSFDDYKMPVYIYSTALAIKAFGVNAFSVRFSSAFFGSCTVVALYFLLYELSKKRNFALIASFFLAVNPWHLFFSRTGYEVNMATALLVMGTLFFVMAVGRKNNLFLFFISILSFIIALYTYNVTRLLSPLIFCMLLFFYHKRINQGSKKLFLSLIILFFLGMLPFFITLATMQSQPGFASQQDALLIGKVAKAEILQTRSYFVLLPSFVQKILFNYWVLLIWKFLGGMVSFFSASFFFLVGADHPHENIGGFGMFYYTDFPLILFGAYQGLKKKITYLYPFYWWFLFVLFVGSIIVPIPHDDAFGTRTYAVVIPLVIFSAYGMYNFLKFVVSKKNKIIKSLMLTGAVLLLGYSYVFYLTSYFIRFPVEYAKEWRSEDQKIVVYITSMQNKYKKIVFDDSAEFLYTSFLFYGKYPPRMHQQQAVYKQNGLVTTLVADGKYEFRKVDFEKEISTPGTLVITSKDHTPQNKKPLAIFSYPTRPVVLFYDRKIAQYPITDVAYEVFASGDNK